MKTFEYKNHFSYHRGVALLIAVMILTSALAIALGIYNIYSGEILLSEDARESYKAFYAANTGLECIMYYNKYPPGGDPTRNYNFFLPPLWSAPGTLGDTKPIVCGEQTFDATLDEENVDILSGEIINRTFSINMNNGCITNAILTFDENPDDVDQYIVSISIEGVNFNPGYDCGGIQSRNQVQRGLQSKYNNIQKPLPP